MKPLVTVLEVERAHLFVGREREIARVTAWLQSSAAQSAVLAIQGVGGIGKSALFAVAQAEEFDAGSVALSIRPDDVSSVSSDDTDFNKKDNRVEERSFQDYSADHT